MSTPIALTDLAPRWLIIDDGGSDWVGEGGLCAPKPGIEIDFVTAQGVTMYCPDCVERGIYHRIFILFSERDVPNSQRPFERFAPTGTCFADLTLMPVGNTKSIVQDYTKVLLNGEFVEMPL